MIKVIIDKPTRTDEIGEHMIPFATKFQDEVTIYDITDEGLYVAMHISEFDTNTDVYESFEAMKEEMYATETLCDLEIKVK